VLGETTSANTAYARSPVHRKISDSSISTECWCRRGIPIVLCSLGLNQERVRSASPRAYRASGTPTWSPHDLRHRRISLWHRQGETWALIGARVGQRSLSVTADTYTQVLVDDRELNHAQLVDELAIRR